MPLSLLLRQSIVKIPINFFGNQKFSVCHRRRVAFGSNAELSRAIQPELIIHSEHLYSTAGCPQIMGLTATAAAVG